MRIASFITVGIAVTSGFLALRYLSERDDTGEQRPGDREPPGGGEVPTPTPTPQPREGDTLTISLSNEPATHYSRSRDDDGYSEVGARAANGRAHYDSALSHAATEMAIQSAMHTPVTLEPVTTFILHSAGAPDSTAARFSLRTNDASDDVVHRAIDEALSAPPGGVGELYFGVGEADTPSDGHARHIVVLMARRAFELDSTPRSATTRSRWHASGLLPRGYADASAKVLYPDGRLEDAELDVDGRRFTLTVDTGPKAGQLSVGIDGVGESGPGKLMQMTVEVGQPIPRQLTLLVPAADPPLDTIADAEDHAALLLAIDREQAGRKPLEIDDALTAIARSHSDEMAQLRYFGHQSPNTGLAGDRLATAGYRASSFAENLAKNDSLAEAESSLLGSVGHRANLLSDDFTHVGVGVARALERGQTQWYVTQVFARKTVDIDEDELIASIEERAGKKRSEAGQPPLEHSETLADVARRGAARAAGGDTRNIAKRLGAEARDALRRSVVVSVQVIYAESQLELPSSVESDDARSIGVGVVQSQSDSAGRIGVVIITGQ